MAVITVASSKGGAGKTTIARVLLGHAAQRGYRVGALDADRNATLQDWAQHTSKVPMHVEAVQDETKIVSAIEELTASFDFIVADTAGAAGQATLFAVGCADLVLIPAQLSSADLLEAAKTVRLANSAAQLLGRKIETRVVLTGFKPRTALGDHVEREIAASGLPRLATRLHDLVAFKEMTFNGIVPATGPAGMQADALFDEVLELLGEEAPSLRAAS